LHGVRLVCLHIGTHGSTVVRLNDPARRAIAPKLASMPLRSSCFPVGLRWAGVCAVALATLSCERLARDKEASGGGAVAWQAATVRLDSESAEPATVGDSANIPTFQETARPRVVRRFGDSLDFAEITAVYPISNSLVVSDVLTDPHLSVIDLKSGRITARLGRNGEGPSELRVPRWITRDKSLEDAVWVYDFSNRRFTRLQLEEEDKPRLDREVSLNVGASIESPVWTNDGLITNGVFLDYTLLTLDPNGRPIRRIAAAPPFGTRQIAHNTGRRMLNRTFMTTDPSVSRLALAYQWANRIDLFRVDGVRYASIGTPSKAHARFRVDDRDKFHWADDTKMGYIRLSGSSRFVYALHCGCTDVQAEGPVDVDVFTWQGAHVKRMTLPESAFEMFVTDDDRLMYIAVEDPYPHVVELALVPP
jgi:hypothetical protein